MDFGEVTVQSITQMEDIMMTATKVMFMVTGEVSVVD